MKKLVEIVAKLRAPGGCPWDRKQTHLSLLPYLLEETWEVIGSVEEGKIGSSLKEELGDVLLQVALHAQIADEDKRFNIDDIIESIRQKIINRHPHVFGEKPKEISEEQLKKQWEEIKSQEHKRNSIQDDIPRGAPALLNALTIGERAANLNFDWETSKDVIVKVEEELDEIREEMEEGNVERIEEEIGDLLFTIANFARFYNINPEMALQKGNQKFLKRFKNIEQAIEKARESGENVTREEMEELWNQSKSAS